MISLDGADFTSASLAKKSSPVRQELVQGTGKVIKSIFVPNVGWASQVTGPSGRSGFLLHTYLLFSTYHY